MQYQKINKEMKIGFMGMISCLIIFFVTLCFEKDLPIFLDYLIPGSMLLLSFFMGYFITGNVLASISVPIYFIILFLLVGLVGNLPKTSKFREDFFSLAQIFLPLLFIGSIFMANFVKKIIKRKSQNPEPNSK